MRNGDLLQLPTRNAISFTGSCLAGLILSLSAQKAVAQDLVLLTTTDNPSQKAATGAIIDDDEILRLQSNDLDGLDVLISKNNWAVLFGDTNADGSFNDSPTEVDAIAPVSKTVGSAYDFLISFDTDRRLIDGRMVRDGDLLRLQPGGTAEIIFSEQEIAGAIETFENIDVDGAALLADGSLLFSLARDAITLSPSLGAENGSPLLNDHTVIRLAASTGRAHIAFHATDLVDCVNHALGTGYVSLIDVQGIEVDPTNSREILFTTGISTGPASSTVFSTRGGGMVATLGGRALTGAIFGLAEDEDLNALALVTETSFLSFNTMTPSVSIDQPVELEIGGGTPFGRGKILVSPRKSGGITPEARGDFRGVGHLYTDRNDPIFRAALRSPKTDFAFDDRGNAHLRLAPSARLVGTTLILQAVEINSKTLSHPVAVEITD